jgi:hypothetical protein
MYPKRSDILLTNLTGLPKNTILTVKWTPECQTAFDKMKALLAKEAFLRYPDHNKPFHIYTDASELQLGAVIFQEGVPVAFYSRKLNKAQRNYTVGEKELLSIVETLREFRSMLYGCPEVHVYIDHKHITLPSCRLRESCVGASILRTMEYIFITSNMKTASSPIACLAFRLPRGRTYTTGRSFGPPTLQQLHSSLCAHRG